MHEGEFLVNYEELLSLHLVTNVAIVIDSSGVIPGSSSVVDPARDQHYLGIQVTDSARGVPKVALNQGREPPAVDFLVDEISIKGLVPPIPVVTGYQL